MEEMSLEQGLEEIGHKILVLTRNELYMKMRFMDVALSAFYYVQDFLVAVYLWQCYTVFICLTFKNISREKVLCLKKYLFLMHCFILYGVFISADRFWKNGSLH